MAIGRVRTVLVVEDDEGMREAIETLMQAANIEFATYASAEALLADVAVVDGADCLISDLKLPGMSGFQLLGALRARSSCPPVIMITAHDSTSVHLEALRLGAAAYLPKPFSGSDLLAAIEKVTIQ